MMTLDDAIAHAREKAEELRKEATIELNEKLGNSRADCLECANDHRQLEKWLMELKELRELVHLLLMCGIRDKTALGSGNVTNEEWLRMMNLIDKYQSNKENDNGKS